MNPNTWMLFALAYLLATYAFRTDAVLVFLRQAGNSCRELSNGTIIAMFCGMIFFGFTAVLTLGEFQRFVEYRQRAAHRGVGQGLGHRNHRALGR